MQSNDSMSRLQDRMSSPPSGGESTIVNLLTRFHDPSVGVVSLDGKDMRDYRLTDLRNQFAIVPQKATDDQVAGSSESGSG